MRLKFSTEKNLFRKINVKVLILLVLELLPVSQPVYSAPQAQGQTRQFETGDVFLSVGSSQVNWYDSNRTFIGPIYSKFDQQAGELAISPFNNHLFLTHFSAPNIAEFDLFGNFTNGISITSAFNRSFASVVFDARGNAFVGDNIGNILMLDRSGNVVTEFKANDELGIRVPAEVWLDLSVDQKTLFYSSGDRIIRRFDIANRKQLNDFATLPPLGPVFARSIRSANLRLLYPGDGSGGLLIIDTVDIKRLDQFGKFFTYDYHGPEENDWIALSLDPDGKSFWATSGSRVYKFDIETGAVVPIVELSQTDTIWGLTIMGAPFAAQPTPMPTITPITPSATLSVTPVTPTVTPTLTSTPPFINPTFPPVATNAPVPVSPRFNFPWVLIIVGLFVSALIIGGAVLLIRTPQPAQPTHVNSKSLPRVRVRGHADVGKQTVEPSPNLSLPQLRLRAGQGEIRYTIQSEDPQQDRGE